MQVAAPVRDDSGAAQGALALVINPDAEFTRILSVARPGESGETFAFDPEGLLISESRFDDVLKEVGLLEDQPEARSALTLRLLDPGGDLTADHRPDPGREQPLMAMVLSALSGKAGVELTPFRDYRGVPVVGAWRWLPQYDFGVGTKMDAREAYRPLRVVRGVFLILFLLLVLASVLIALFSYMQTVWRRRLTEAELMARQLGQYTLKERIGAGGMGVVYKAQHALLRRETAIKLLPPERSDPADIERFEQEVQLTCRLSHPNTIQVYDYGHTPDGVFYYAMEYLEGLHLGELVAQYGPQSESRVIHILRQVCGSLGEAHRLGLIHRDIKPANVFLCDRGGVPDSIKVLDFGLVQHLDEARRGARGISSWPHPARPGVVVGTPNFIAPESLKDPMQSDARSDVYAVGALGYFLLTGHYVFEGDSIDEVSRKHLTEPPTAPSARRGQPLCPDLESIILRCLEKDPAARPSSAEQLGALLAASPCANEWTKEQQVTWWMAHRTAQAGLTPVTNAPASSSRDATVHINLGERQQ
jgi:serine/threonine protein kinase